jgi:hypothetical protein
MKQYYLTSNGHQSGPFPESEVQSMLAAGDAASDDLCWAEGMDDWKPIHEVIQQARNVPRPIRENMPLHGRAVQAVIFCTKCGERNPENNFKCSRCGIPLHASPSPSYVISDGSMGGLIPVKNSSALIGYYLGVFALIPVLGIPLGIAAVILGNKGLKFAKLHPDAKGVGHAWTAIILGGLSAVGYTLLIAIPILMALAN